MSLIARSSTGAGALFTMSGEIATNATWEEDIYFTEAGLPMDISDLDWKLTLRDCEGEPSAFRTLSTSEGTLSIEDDDDGFARILRISLTDQSLNGYEGDFIADLASEDVSGKVVLWAHGTISLRPNPVAF